MKNRVLPALAPALAVVAAALSLSACEDGYGGSSVAVGWGPGPYAYDAYYDGYYGPLYDGYWGNDGGFWYRSGAGDRRYRRGDPGHFRRDMPNGGNWGGRSFQRYQGNIPSRPAGTRMPHFPHQGR